MSSKATKTSNSSSPLLIKAKYFWLDTRSLINFRFLVSIFILLLVISEYSVKQNYMKNREYYTPTAEEISLKCEEIRKNRSPDTVVPMSIDSYIKLYSANPDFIQEKAEEDGMDVEAMSKDTMTFVFYLINKSLGSSDNFHCADCSAINDSFGKLCQRCYYKSRTLRKKNKKKNVQ
jgi:hypothetical protein